MTSFYFNTRNEADNEVTALRNLGWVNITVTGDSLHGFAVHAYKPKYQRTI